MAYIKKNVKGRMMYPGGLDAYSRTRGYSLKDITIEKNGRIEISTDQKLDNNDFSISFNIFDLNSNEEYPDGIKACIFLIHFRRLLF